MRTYVYRSVTLTSYTSGESESKPVSSPFGPVRAGLITTPRTSEDQVLTELLNSLEKQIAELSIKSLEVLNTFLKDTKHLVKHTSSFSSIDITDDM